MSIAFRPFTSGPAATGEVRGGQHGRADGLAVGTDWAELARIDCRNVPDGSVVTVRGTLGAGGGPLTGLKVQDVLVPGGAMRDYLVDGDLASGAWRVPFCSPANPHTTAAGASFEIELRVEGKHQIVLSARAASANVVDLEVSV